MKRQVKQMLAAALCLVMVISLTGTPSLITCSLFCFFLRIHLLIRRSDQFLGVRKFLPINHTRAEG